MALFYLYNSSWTDESLHFLSIQIDRIESRGVLTQDVIDIKENALNNRGFSVRSLEKKIREILKDDTRVSKSLINYQKRKTVPTYMALYQLAVAMDLDVKKVLAGLHEYRGMTISIDRKMMVR